ncbi:uncharacterized protein KRP23_1720 [Phytophthora ramorum]|uniref:uncharacterized protein n=1 Tax=Phytophthora ramorum TaxID=164328 RepID=UPI00309974E4|nr:hypothetical protein KRP23_1720 [Phytophthora ramorum]
MIGSSTCMGNSLTFLEKYHEKRWYSPPLYSRMMIGNSIGTEMKTGLAEANVWLTTRKKKPPVKFWIPPWSKSSCKKINPTTSDTKSVWKMAAWNANLSRTKRTTLR